MEIIITRNDVYQYAMALTARAATTGDAFNQTAITEDNFPMLGIYLSEAVSLAEGELRKKLSQSNTIDMALNESSISILIKEQRNADISVYNLIKSGVRLFLAYHIASKWLQTSPSSGLAEVYGVTAATHLKNAAETLHLKTKVVIPESDYESRNVEGSRMESGTGNGSDYTKRTKDMTDMSSNLPDDDVYSKRKNDNVMARPGTRITENEIITVYSENCYCQIPAKTKKRELLLFKHSTRL